MINVRGKDMLLIEAHAHVWDSIHGRRFDTCTVESVQNGKVKIGDDIVQFMPPEWRDCKSPIEVLQTYEELMGFDKVVLLQTPCYGPQYEYINAILAKYPGRYATVGVPNPQNKTAYLNTVRLCLGEYGYKGLKFESPDIPFAMLAPQNAFIYEEIMKFNAYFVMDMGWGTGPHDYPIDDMLEIARRYPMLKIILPHLGVSRIWDPKEYHDNKFDCLRKTLSILERSENVWFDMSGLPALVEQFDEYPYPTIAKLLTCVKEEGGIGRVMWGSDMPTALCPCTYKQHLTTLTLHCDFLSDSELENILGKTAQRVWFD